MLPIRFKYLDPISKKKSKINFEEIENFEIKQKRIGPIKKRIFDPPSHTHTHTHPHPHTHTHTHTYTHTHIHTDILKKSCILIPNTSENNYNKFLQQLKKLISQSFL